MEPIFLICIAAALFAHAWYAMGMFNDGRSTGVVVAALGAGALIALTVDPVLVGTETKGVAQAAEINIFTALIVLWAVYAGGLAAHGVYDFDDRAVGFFGVPLAAISITAAGYASTQMVNAYDWTVWLAIAVSGVLLGLVGIVLFFNLGCRMRALDGLASWTMLVFSVVIAAIGIAILTTGVVA